MIEIVIPGSRYLVLKHLVMDYNGTLAMDGVLLSGVRPRLAQLAQRLHLHVVTADTFGTSHDQLQGLDCQLFILEGNKQSRVKLKYIQKLGVRHVAALGNGYNDRLMLRAAALGIAVVQGEGAAAATCRRAQLIAPDIITALDLFLYPKRLIASLRR